MRGIRIIMIMGPNMAMDTITLLASSFRSRALTCQEEESQTAIATPTSCIRQNVTLILLRRRASLLEMKDITITFTLMTEARGEFDER